MKKEYWLNRWETGNIRFNEPQPHRFLLKHFERFSSAHHKNIFFPFCGASIDMSWVYSQGYFVSGIDISPIAISKYINDNGLILSISEEGSLKKYSNKTHSLYQGDLFNLSAIEMNDYHLIYDRGGFTALPPSTIRSEYIDWLKITLPINTTILLITLEHSNPSENEPPFSVSTNELKNYFTTCFEVERLEREEILDIKPHWLERGVRDLYECAHILKKIK